MAEVMELRERLLSSGISITHMKIGEKTMKRYLKAHHTVDAAYEKIMATNSWRGEFGVASITADIPGVKRETATSKCIEDGLDNICLVFDMKDFSMMCMDYTVLKNLFTIMTDHYPERLGVCVILSAPFIFSACWIIIRSWLDENTAGKIKFIKSNDDLRLYIDPSFLPINL
ncbi:CRAL-TRIO domain-containing protein C589.09, mitochondrial-like isoform X4 [Homarus americanus]|uniref:CRAL-TRIO domain-containing protein C589.09, mitochondrial-like isoform X4 n=1 Tax=Homarus americanus TaxID=6706 RepID=UPI001C45253C|nr:CRAL-TRIO domain-containing protein C589.09, mitochondrial-like isoform X4 [Homarus americanus]